MVATLGCQESGAGITARHSRAGPPFGLSPAAARSGGSHLIADPLGV